MQTNERPTRKLLSYEPRSVRLEIFRHDRNRPKVACHTLKLDTKINLRYNGVWSMSTEKYEVDKLLENGFNLEARYLV